MQNIEADLRESPDLCGGIVARGKSEWSESRLQAEVIGQPETYMLEFKSGKLLDESNSEKVAGELSRAVSGFANERGGQIIVGVSEEGSEECGTATRIDGVDGSKWPTDRLYRVIEHNVQPHVRLKITRIDVPRAGPGRVVFVIDVPEGVSAHQAKDCCYYGRSEVEFRKLKDHEIRLRMQRATALTADVELYARVLRQAQELRQRQIADLRVAIAQLAAGNIRSLDETPGFWLPERAQDEPPLPIDQVSDEQIAREITPRIRFDELALSVVLKNTCERTIQDFEIGIDAQLPSDWLLTRTADVQPLHGFASSEEIASVAQLRNLHIAAWRLTRKTRGRLLPGTSIEATELRLLIPEGSVFDSCQARLAWMVYLDNAPPSRGEIDIGAAAARALGAR